MPGATLAIPRRLRAAAMVAAVPERLCPALWAALCESLALAAQSDLLAVLEARGLAESLGADAVFVDAGRRARLAEAFARQDPVRWRRAHVICARFFARRGAEGDLAVTVEHLLASGDRRKALELVRLEGGEMLDAERPAAVLDVVRRFGRGDTPAPACLVYLEARALERSGDLAGAIDAYRRLLERHETGALPRWVPPIARVCGEAGQIALRAGRLELAEALLARGERLAGPPGARRGEPASGTTAAALERLAARIDLAHGRAASARRRFGRAARRARSCGDEIEECESLSGMGVVEMRLGDPVAAAAHYRAALVCGAGPERLARIRANLAMALAFTGRWREAITLFEEAALEREKRGDLAGAANSGAALAGSREGAGDRRQAALDLARARRLAEQADDQGLLAEILLLRSSLASREGHGGVARATLREAEDVLATVEHPDPLLLGVLEEARAERWLGQRDHPRAAWAARRALRVFLRHGSRYFAGRALLLFARIAFAAGRKPAASRHLERLAHLCSAAPGYRFATSWAAAPLLRAACSWSVGSQHVRDLCRTLLGESETTTSPPTPRGLRSRAGPGPLRLLTREGTSIATDAELERVRRSPGDLLVDIPRQTIVTRAGKRAIGGRSVVLPLLLFFLERPGGAFEASEVHRSVWGSDLFDAAAATRTKVALHRLRRLVGRDVVRTARTVEPTGTARTLLSLSDLSYAVIDRG